MTLLVSHIVGILAHSSLQCGFSSLRLAGTHLWTALLKSHRSKTPVEIMEVLNVVSPGTFTVAQVKKKSLDMKDDMKKY